MEYSTNNGFGLLIPSEGDQTVVHKSGGVAITYPTFNGLFIPLKKSLVHISPSLLYDDIPNVDEFYSGFPVDELNEQRQRVVSEDKTVFSDYREFSEEVIDGNPYIHSNLIDALRSLNYNVVPNQNGYDYSDDFTSQELWQKIDKRLPFEYDLIEPTFTKERGRSISNKEAERLKSNIPKADQQTLYGEGIRWIEITECNSNMRSRSLHDIESIIGEVCALLYPNCD